MSDTTDQLEIEWGAVARRAQQALDLLGYPVERCLTGQEGAAGCGLPDHLHALSYLATILEVATHHLEHYQAPAEVIDDFREIARVNLLETCHRGHGR